MIHWILGERRHWWPCPEPYPTPYNIDMTGELYLLHWWRLWSNQPLADLIWGLLCFTTLLPTWNCSFVTPRITHTDTYMHVVSMTKEDMNLKESMDGCMGQFWECKLKKEMLKLNYNLKKSKNKNKNKTPQKPSCLHSLVINEITPFLGHKWVVILPYP